MTNTAKSTWNWTVNDAGRELHLELEHRRRRRELHLELELTPCSTPLRPRASREPPHSFGRLVARLERTHIMTNTANSTWNWTVEQRQVAPISTWNWTVTSPTSPRSPPGTGTDLSAPPHALRATRHPPQLRAPGRPPRKDPHHDEHRELHLELDREQLPGRLALELELDREQRRGRSALQLELEQSPTLPRSIHLEHGTDLSALNPRARAAASSAISSSGRRTSSSETQNYIARNVRFAASRPRDAIDSPPDYPQQP